jgi:hypothetical protein
LFFVIKLVLPIGQFRLYRKRFCQNRIGVAKVGFCKLIEQKNITRTYFQHFIVKFELNDTKVNLAEELISNYSSGKIEKIAKHAIANRTVFEELMTYYIGENQRLAQMASWCVSHAVDIDKSIIIPYIQNLVDVLYKSNKHDAVIRNALRILQFVEIPEYLQGKVMNKCFEFIEQPLYPAAFKAYSLTVIFNLSMIYPDIKSELKTVIEILLPTESAAFKSRGKKILNKLNKK